MKVPFVFVAGLGLGVLCGWAGASRGPCHDSVEGSAQAGAPAPKPALAASAAIETPDARSERPARPPKPEKPDKPIVRTFSSTDGEQTPEMKEIMERMKQAQQEKRARKVDERLAALKSRLGLTDEQAAKVRAVLEHGEDGGDGAGDTIDVAKLLNGESKDERDAADGKLAGLLTPDQQAKFQAFQQEQKENRIEIATNREMTRLQQGLTLTAEQKDRAYQALGELAQREDDQPATKGIDPQQMMARQQARRDALSPILTPEQMKAYEGMPMQAESGAVSIQFQNIGGK
ncbi:hypothetical protein [Luteolibacter sp. LG18]|uniref:hypothetical protein n=1 Tax=Luteolibacter sp. LG18 TaxID=2819286 RepID=UPI002B2F678B|nr:hypothetical protein llg_09260 [Luteolibacter sp. LG18]